MRLSWKDGVTTLLAGLAGAVTFALTSGWSWPVVGDARVAAVVVWALGVAMCPVAWVAVQATTGDRSARESLNAGLGLDSGYYRVMSGLAIIPTALAIWGLLAPAAGIVVAEMAFVGIMWLVATVAHAAGGAAPSRVAPIS